MIKTIKEKAEMLFDRSFNLLSFDFFKKAVGEDSIIEYIERPSEEVIRKEMDEDNLKGKSKDEISDAIDEFYLESENYPMWNTIFEAKDSFISDKIMGDIDGLYELGIGVIAPTDDTNACLFIAGAGYDFYDFHWIPLFKHWHWLKENEEIDFTETTLGELLSSKNETIKRNAVSILKQLQKKTA